MTDNEQKTLVVPSTYADAEAILQKVSQVDADIVWAELTEQQAETLLKSLAPGFKPVLPKAHPPHKRPSQADSSAAPPDLSDRSSPLPHLSEETLLKVLETAPDAIVVVDSRGVIVRVNAQAENMFGYRREELEGKKVEILVPVRNQRGHVADRQGFFKQPYTRAMGQMGKPLFGLRKDGREFPVEISLSPLKTEESLQLVTSTIRDITQRKEFEAERSRNEAELAKAEARYRSLVEDIPAVTFIAPFDEGLGELYVSPQIIKMLGFTQEEWLNDPVLWHRQLHPEDRERWHREFARTCATAQPFRSVYRFLARDGRTVWVHGEAKVVRDKAGRPLFLQGVAFDITERKEAEAALTQLNRTLNERVAARTAELKRSNDDLANIGYYTAHQIKKPIGRINDIINGSLMPGQPIEPAETRLAHIQRVTGEMEKLVMALLNYARATDKDKFMRIDCAVLVREVYDELRPNIDAVCSTVSWHFLPTVFADREALKSVFFNLIENAIKYRDVRPLTVSVSAQRQQDAWLFRVADNGMGIPKHPDLPPEFAASHNYHKKIFEFGGRVNDRTPQGDKIPGHGIGLSHCEKVIEYHDGKIWVESEVGKGSTFYFTLPSLPDSPA
jgi:two-component system sensor kinase FixL